MPNVKIIAGPDTVDPYDPSEAHVTQDVPERFVEDSPRDPYFGDAAICEIFDTIAMWNDVCEHGMSASLCDGPNHYAPDNGWDY